MNIKADHERFVSIFETAKSNREFVTNALKDPRLLTILKRFESEIESKKEELITAEKKEIDGLQASVQARRALLATLRAAYEADVEDAQKNLREFETQNQLFLTSGPRSLQAQA